jgi:hypothetical protein
MREKNAYKIVVGKPEVNRSFGLQRHRWGDNIKKGLKEI